MEISSQVNNVITAKYANRPGLTYAEAAAVLAEVTGVKITDTTIKTYVKAGKLTVAKVSTHWLVNIDSLKALKFDAPTRSATAKKPGRKPAAEAVATAK